MKKCKISENFICSLNRASKISFMFDDLFRRILNFSDHYWHTDVLHQKIKSVLIYYRTNKEIIKNICHVFGPSWIIMESILKTGVTVKMCWWHVEDFDDRFKMLATDIIHWKISNTTSDDVLFEVEYLEMVTITELLQVKILLGWIPGFLNSSNEVSIWIACRASKIISNDTKLELIS